MFRTILLAAFAALVATSARADVAPEESLHWSKNAQHKRITAAHLTPYASTLFPGLDVKLKEHRAACDEVDAAVAPDGTLDVDDIPSICVVQVVYDDWTTAEVALAPGGDFVISSRDVFPWGQIEQSRNIVGLYWPLDPYLTVLVGIEH